MSYRKVHMLLQHLFPTKTRIRRLNIQAPAFWDQSETRRKGDLVVFAIKHLWCDTSSLGQSAFRCLQRLLFPANFSSFHSKLKLPPTLNYYYYCYRTCFGALHDPNEISLDFWSKPHRGSSVRHTAWMWCGIVCRNVNFYEVNFLH